jgi:hypothetical protein
MKYEIQELGLKVDREITWAQWKKLGRVVGSTVKVGPWLLGDWVNFGESKWGEKYAQAVDETGLSPERLRVCSWVSNRYPRARRRTELSFEAHREFAYESDDSRQDELLQMAVDNGMDSKEIREWKRIERGNTVDKSPLYKFTLESEDTLLEAAEFEELCEGMRELCDEFGLSLLRCSRPD